MGQQRPSNDVCVTSAIIPTAARSGDSLWRGTLVVVFAIGAGWIGYMGWPLNAFITRAAEQSTQAPAVFQDPNCPGNDKHALMCRLVNG
jgi:hypothetical protein